MLSARNPNYKVEKIKEETEIIEQNTHPIKTNSEIRTYTYKYPNASARYQCKNTINNSQDSIRAQLYYDSKT